MGLCCVRGYWVGLMRCLSSRLMAQLRAAVTGRSTPVSSSTSSSRPTLPPPRTGEAAVLLPGRVGSGVTAPGLPFAVSVCGKEGDLHHPVQITSCHGSITRSLGLRLPILGSCGSSHSSERSCSGLLALCHLTALSF